MKTEELISALAADTLRRATVGQRLARALPVALAVCVVAFALVWGLRPDLAEALRSPAVLKTVVPLLLVGLAGAVALRLARPVRQPGAGAMALGLVAVVLAGGFGVALAQAGAGALVDALHTPSLVVCLLSIPALALPLLAGVFWALSDGASLRPRLAGAAGGLMAGGLAAAVYSFYCDQDAALFVLPAYSTAVLAVALTGALAGPRLLRW